MSARFLDFRSAFDHPVTVWLTIAIGAILIAAPMILIGLAAAGRLGEKQRTELWQRYWSWLAMAPLLAGPILLGGGWTMAAVAVLSIACYREYARATGLFRERHISAVIVLGIACLTLASFDHWFDLFMALGPLMASTIAIMSILQDRPQGYIQRVALGVFGFVLFGSCLGYLGYFANDRHYRPILLMLIVTVELNDVFAYITGKLFGRSKLCPNTSPGKTVAGSLGSLVLTTGLTAWLAHHVFRGSAIDQPLQLIVLGLIVGVVGQFGDLMLSSIKRDLGIKDMAATIPGHGGLLDRFDSLLLVAPAAFHFIAYFVGVGEDQPRRWLTGG